jgi:hypothetical protein
MHRQTAAARRAKVRGDAHSALAESEKQANDIEIMGGLAAQPEEILDLSERDEAAQNGTENLTTDKLPGLAGALA